jgi:hypothetical protein
MHAVFLFQQVMSSFFEGYILAIIACSAILFRNFYCYFLGSSEQITRSEKDKRKTRIQSQEAVGKDAVVSDIKILGN